MTEIYILYMLLPPGYKLSYWLLALLAQLAVGLPFCLWRWLWRWVSICICICISLTANNKKGSQKGGGKNKRAYQKIFCRSLKFITHSIIGLLNQQTLHYVMRLWYN